jgi:hypothetical protein
MRKILVFLAATLVSTAHLTAACCNDWCDGWPTLTTCCDRSPWPSAFNIDIGGGYRQDKFKWSIPGPNCSPNVLSEIEWRKLRIAQVEGTLKYVSCRNYAIRLDASFGRIYHGKMIDADFFENHRRGLFSLSENNAGKGHVYDLSAAVGYRATSTCGRFTATPLVGYSQYAQYLRAFDGHQIIDVCNGFTGRFDGLNSQYNTRWFGPWLGVDFEAQVERCAYLYGSVQWHMLTYRGHGKWNLRRDMGPFVHKAYGYGYLAQLGGKWEIWNNWSLGIQGSYRMYRTKHGSERVRLFFEDESIILRTRFNGAQWHAWTVSGIIAWRY